MTEMDRHLKKSQEKKIVFYYKKPTTEFFPWQRHNTQNYKKIRLFIQLYTCLLFGKPTIQVHMFEGLDYSVINEQISRFIPTSDTLFLVYTLIMNIQSFEKSSSSKKKFAQKIASHLSPFQGLKDKGLQRMNTDLFGYLQASCP